MKQDNNRFDKDFEQKLINALKKQQKPKFTPSKKVSTKELVEELKKLKAE